MKYRHIAPRLIQLSQLLQMDILRVRKVEKRLQKVFAIHTEIKNSTIFMFAVHSFNMLAPIGPPGFSIRIRPGADACSGIFNIHRAKAGANPDGDNA